MRKLPAKQVAMALVVEVIRRFWEQGLYRSNKVLRFFHDGWLPQWIDWRAQLAGRSLDRQAKELTPEPGIMPPLYWEEEEGETPLGGAFGYTYEFDNAPGGSDPVQGAE